jgi:hypothetical protein
MSTSSKRQKEFPELPKKPDIYPLEGPKIEPVKPDYPNFPKPIEIPDQQRTPEIKPNSPSEFDARAPGTVFD